MADLKRLVGMMQELDDQLVTCMRCGMCQAVCPLFAQTGREADVARGKLALLDGLTHEMLKDPLGVNERLNRCLLCGTCEANCPSGVKVLDIFLKARAIMTGYLGLPPAQKAIFRGLLANPKLFNTLLGIGSKFQGLFTKPVDDMLGSSCARFNSPLIGDRHFKRLAARPFHKIVAKLDEPRQQGGRKVAFFVGCVLDKVFPEVAEAALVALKRNGVAVFLPENQACCGIPAISGGDVKTFEKLIAQNLEVFAGSDFDHLLTACATCTSTIRKVWKSMARKPELAEAVARLADKTMDVSQYLVDVVGVKPAALKAGAPSVTYHDPCHLKNSLGITAQPRTVIAAAGYALKEMTDAGTCCGCGGSFNLKHYELSKTIGGRKADNVVASGAGLVATSCPACMLQLTDMLSQKGAKIPVKHVLQLYASGA